MTRLAIALPVAVTSTLASAGIVTQWDYTLNSQWTSATFTNGVGNSGSSPADTSFSSNLLSWGVPAGGPGQSSLRITNPPSPGSVSTYIGGGVPPAVFAAPGSTLTHTNNPIFAPSLLQASLQATLNLTPVAPPGGGFGLPPLSFNIAFAETTNTPPCAVTTSPTPCNDIFVLVGGLLNASFFYDSDGAGSDPAQQYFVNIFPVNSGGALQVLDAGVCAAASQPNGCIGFTTPEGQQTSLPFGFTISTQRLTTVPEPGTLVLVALAMLGLARARSRRA